MKSFTTKLKRFYTKKFDKPLEWHESFLPNGTAFYTHPTFEEVMAVKQYRMTQQTINPEDVIKIKQLRDKDPWTNNAKVLSTTFGVSRTFVNLVAKEPKVKVLQDLARLKEYHKNKPKRSSKQFLNNRKIGLKINSKK